MPNIPNGFSIGSLNIKFYGILMATAMAIGVILACINAKKRNLKSNDILVLACYVLPLAVIGARVCYFIFENDRFSSFWQIFEIWKGGLAIYGGVIGGALGILLFCLIHKKNFLDVADVAVPSLILGQAIGRWGNFFNQEAYGYAINDPKWQFFPFGVYIENCTQEICNCTGSGWHLATFFYEFVFNILIFIVLMVLLRKIKIKEKGIVMASYLLMYGLVRFFIEGLRTDPLMIGEVRAAQLFSGLIFAFAIIFILVVYILKYKKLKQKKICEGKQKVTSNNNLEKSFVKKQNQNEKFGTQEEDEMDGKGKQDH